MNNNTALEYYLLKFQALMKKKLLVFILVLFSISGWGPFSFFHRKNHQVFASREWINDEIKIISSQATNLNEDILKLGLKAYLKARNTGLTNKRMLTIIDYSKPSTQQRLWVIDLEKDTVVYNTWVTHGKNSGDTYATSFSNKLGSLQSSYGVFLTTGEPYIGEHGYSLRLVGLEPGINDNAYRRDIVFHGGWYANPAVVKQYGQLGKSWGCPTVSDRLARPLIDTIKEKTVVFAYAKKKDWINHSVYLSG